ncbi:S-layer homology domain-containing protein [Paenalkalicoccus suaedae]|uniref:S-layer homology domain-containing protein n=1 Tax=Paenalkalicoccus suaedae TaxID=2592382 RepID=A0A859FHK7_9BACI|nr:S-layer homology domain-containing protein [Paenalkalicoccus suaedae]QKS72617.1 S-layer homology domain-containing protein [Paenalkalicoccus suaedae]
MKKYPISKKAIAVAIVTTMAITPFATLAPLAGDSSTAYASEVEVAEVRSEVRELAGKVTTIYSTFRADTSTNGVQSRITFDAIRDNVRDTDLAEWQEIVNATNGEILELDGDAGELLFSARFVQGLAEIFTNSNPTSLEEDLEDFIAEFEDGFTNVFPDISIADLFVIANQLEAEFRLNKPFATDLSRNNIRAYLEARVNAVAARNDNELQAMLDILSDYGITRDGVASMFIELRDTVAPADNQTFSNTRMQQLAITLFRAAQAFEEQPPVVQPPGGGGGVPPVDPEDPEEPETPIDDEEVTVPDDTTSEERVTDPVTGQVTVITTVNAEQLAALLDGEEFDRVSFNLTPADGEYAVLRLSDDVLDVIRAANPDAIIEVATLEGSFAIPVAELDYTSVDISVNEVDFDASENQVTPVAPVVEFLVVATINGQEVEITRFNAPVERTITANDDLSNNSVVVRLNTNGTITGVATKRDGDTATFTGFTNSLYTVVENSVSYSDVPSSLWSSEVINKLSTQYILRGFSSGDFRPTGTASRAEFAAIISRGLSLTGGSTYMGQFTDIVGNEWFMGDLVAVTDYDLIRGYENNTFRGNNEVTRQEAATIIVRAMELLGYDFDLDESVSYTDFSDSADVAPYARESVTILSQAGLIEGRPGNNFAPRANISRQEVAALVERFLVKADFLD